MSNHFGNKIRQLREDKSLLLRQVAPYLDIDTPQLSKIERGERQARKEAIPVLAKVLTSNEEELMTLWLADQIVEVVKNNNQALEAMMVAEESVKYIVNQSKKK